jgi:hypothetical protein
VSKDIKILSVHNTQQNEIHKVYGVHTYAVLLILALIPLVLGPDLLINVLIYSHACAPSRNLCPSQRVY